MSNKNTTSDLISKINDEDKAIIWGEFIGLYSNMSNSLSSIKKLPTPLLLTLPGLELDNKISRLIKERFIASKERAVLCNSAVSFCGFVHDKNLTDRSMSLKIKRDKKTANMIPLHRKRLEEIKGDNSFEELYLSTCLKIQNETNPKDNMLIRASKALVCLETIAPLGLSKLFLDMTQSPKNTPSFFTDFLVSIEGLDDYSRYSDDQIGGSGEKSETTMKIDTSNPVISY